MLVFLIDMVDMLLAAYFMGVLCEEINKKKIAMALMILVISGSEILDLVGGLNNILVCEFLILILFMKGKLVQRFVWCIELQLLILIFDFLFINTTLIAEQMGKQSVGWYFSSQVLLIIRGLLVLFLVVLLRKQCRYVVKIFSESSILFSVYMIISMGVTNLILYLVQICLKGIMIELIIPIFFIEIVLFSILPIILCVVVQMFIYSKKELKISKEMTREYINQQKEYFKEVNKKNTELKGFYHDFNEHIYTMNDMAAKGNIEELKKYLTDLSKKKETLYYLDTGNLVANAVVNRYYEMAKEQEITFTYMGRLSKKLCGITDVEICSVLSNILKNAFEAVLCVSEDMERKIFMEIGRENQYEYVFLENTANGYKEKNGKLISHKKDRECYGVGMENVRKIMEECGGILEWKYEKGIFYTWIYFLAEEMTS